MFKDLTGQRFGRLVVIRKDHVARNHNIAWLCKCDCGNYHIATTANLHRGSVKSCGCWYRDYIKAGGNNRTTHGKSKTRLYKAWTQMKQRCYNQHKDGYEDYGGRGITVCEEWRNSFEAFYKWSIANGYTDKLSIDRINVNGNYEPSNCRWATNKEQSNNRRSNIHIEYKGEVKTLKQWAEEKGICEKTLKHRIESGWDIEKAMETPPANNCCIIEYKGERKTMRQWADEKGISYNALCIRMKKGWSIEKALETPVRKKSPKKKP